MASERVSECVREGEREGEGERGWKERVVRATALPPPRRLAPPLPPPLPQPSINAAPSMRDGRCHVPSPVPLVFLLSCSSLPYVRNILIHPFISAFILGFPRPADPSALAEFYPHPFAPGWLGVLVACRSLARRVRVTRAPRCPNPPTHARFLAREDQDACGVCAGPVEEGDDPAVGAGAAHQVALGAHMSNLVLLPHLLLLEDLGRKRRDRTRGIYAYRTQN